MQLDSDLESIQSAFKEFKSATKKSLKLKQDEQQKRNRRSQTFIKDLAVCLLDIPSQRAVKDRKELLEHYSDDLNNAKSIDDIFQVVQKFTSFMDYHILKEIIETHGEPEDEKNLAKYTEQLQNFLQNWKVEPLHVKESTKHQTKWQYKLVTDTLAWYEHLKKAIATFLGVKVREVVLVAIKTKPGCVELVFALPTTAVERLLPLTLSQIAEVAEWTPTVLNVKVLDGPLKDKDNIIYEVSFQTDK